MPNERRFAIVCPNFFPRTCGVGDHSARLGQELRRRGFEVTVYSRSPARANPVAPDLPVVGTDDDRPGVIGRRLTEAILATRPTDVIVQYTPQMWNTGRLGSTALPRLAAAAHGAGARTTLIAHEPYTRFGRRPDLVVTSVAQRAQLAYLLAYCDRSFVTTESRLRYVTPFTRLVRRPDPGVLRVGPNAIPVLSTAKLPGPRVGVFSTAATGKRFDIVLTTFERIAQEFPAAELSIIGDLGSPDAPHVRKVTEAIRRHPAAARIRLTGKLELGEIAREVASLNLYLFPVDTGANTRSGTLPVALGAGLPIVAYDGPETDAGFFRNGENISLVSSLDARSFTAAALDLLRNPERAALIAAGARALYEKHLVWDRITDHFLAEIGGPSAA